MIERTVSEQLDFAILSVVSAYPDGEHQDYWAAWRSAVERKFPKLIFTDNDLRFSFEHLGSLDLEITKPDTQQKQATKYSPAMSQGLSEIDSRTFFMTGPFNAKITRDGARYLNRLKNAQ